MEKLEQQELETLSSVYSKVNTIKRDIADVSILEERCINDKKRLMFDFSQANSEYMKMQEDIISKYGNVSVNLQTGEITHNGD
jgi:hypothetical protein